jgi:hypothetical protein
MIEFSFFILGLVFLFFGGYLTAKNELNVALFTTFLGVLFLGGYTMLIIELPIKIKSTEKLELIETIATQTDTTFKYQIINK